MATYSDIENKRKYVVYDYGKINADYGDAYDINAIWCRYWSTNNYDPKTKTEVYNENMASHNYKAYVLKSKTSVFKNIEDTLSKFLPPKNATFEQITETDELVKKFKLMTTYNQQKGDNCPLELMLFACGRIDNEKVSRDIEACNGNPCELRKLINKLSLEINAAALNGLFTKLFCTANQAGINAKDADLIDKKNEQIIFDLYNKVMYGKNNSHNYPLNIPNNTERPFTLINEINTLLKNTYNVRNLSQKEVYKQIIDPCVKIFNRELKMYPNKNIEPTK